MNSVRCDYATPQCNADSTEAWERCEGNTVLERISRCGDHRPQGAEWETSDLYYHPPYNIESWPAGPMVIDKHGVVRFRENLIVGELVRSYSGGLNSLYVRVANGEFSEADYEHLMQLIGYSLGGFADLSGSTDAVYDQADRKSDAMLACQPKSAVEEDAA